MERNGETAIERARELALKIAVRDAPSKAALLGLGKAVVHGFREAADRALLVLVGVVPVEVRLPERLKHGANSIADKGALACTESVVELRATLSIPTLPGLRELVRATALGGRIWRSVGRTGLCEARAREHE
jgi:hypothetical protein